MKFLGLDGQEYNIQLSKYEVYDNDSRPRSSYHLSARRLLREVFPTSSLLEEVLLPGTGTLRLDFLLPLERIGVEVQGEQHYRPTFFNPTTRKFMGGRIRDNRKREWCDLNNIKLITLDCHHDECEWRRSLTS